jgi:hypothetical protein
MESCGNTIVFKPDKNTKAEWYADIINRSMQKDAPRMVLDRCWHSDAIYSRVKDIKPTIWPNDFDILQEMCVYYRVSYKPLLPCWAEIQIRYKFRGDDYVTMDELEKVYHVYERGPVKSGFLWRPYGGDDVVR